MLDINLYMVYNLYISNTINNLYKKGVLEMNFRAEQQKEIETIRERTMKLKLSDADVQRLWERAGNVGLSVTELLENFIGDLVCGTYSNGSDECRLASEWFDRCWFGMFPDKTFLSYLIDCGSVESVWGLYDDIKTFVEELEYSDTHKDEFSEEEIENLKEELNHSQKELDDYFKEFQDWAKEEKGTLEEEIVKVLKWHDEMKLMKEKE